MTSLFLSCYYFLFLLCLTCSSNVVVDAFLIATRTRARTRTGGEGKVGQHVLSQRIRNFGYVLSLKRETSSSSSSSHHHIENQLVVDNNNNNNIRLNKVFKTTHSRRKADRLISDGRVKVNGQIVEDMGRRVVPFEDEIQLDDRPYVGWEVHHGFTNPSINDHDDRKKNQDALRNTGKKKQQNQQHQHYGEEYIKYWKPVGVTSTTDRNIKSNVLDAINKSRSSNVELPIENRIFTVGRLDKDSSGIILLTSDGRVPNAVLRSKFKRHKTYTVRIDRPIKISDLKGLRKGITIKTDRVRRGRHEQIIAKTLPCKVSQQNNDDDNTILKIQLTEGRNRQIRVMLSTLGYNVLELHRDDFMGITLDDMSRPGDWKRLSDDEIQILETAISRAERYETSENSSY